MLVMVSAFMGAVFGGMAARKKNGSSALMSTLASAALAVTARDGHFYFLLKRVVLLMEWT